MRPKGEQEAIVGLLSRLSADSWDEQDEVFLEAIDTLREDKYPPTDDRQYEPDMQRRWYGLAGYSRSREIIRTRALGAAKIVDGALMLILGGRAPAISFTLARKVARSRFRERRSRR